MQEKFIEIISFLRQELLDLNFQQNEWPEFDHEVHLHVTSEHLGYRETSLKNLLKRKSSLSSHISGIGMVLDLSWKLLKMEDNESCFQNSRKDIFQSRIPYSAKSSVKIHGRIFADVQVFTNASPLFRCLESYQKVFNRTKQQTKKRRMST